MNINVPLTHLRATRFCPGSQGGTEWSGAAYNPGLNLIFAGAVDWCTSVTLVAPDSVPSPLTPDLTGNVGGGFGKFDPKERWQGWVTAVNADAGTVAWKYRVATPVLTGIATTAGDPVLTGDMNGNVIVLNARTGVLLRRLPTGAPIGGGVVTYDAGGKQYIAAAAGASHRSGRCRKRRRGWSSLAFEARWVG